MSDVVTFDDFRRASQLVGSLVAEITPTDWTAPTPNADRDVETLVRHVTEELFRAEQLICGADLGRAEQVVAQRMQLRDLKDLFARALVGVETAAAHASSVIRVQTSNGEVPVSEYLDERLAAQLIHGWDLARALRREIALPVDLVEKVAAWFATRESDWRAAGLIGPPVDVDPYASPQARLLAAFGRDSASATLREEVREQR